MTQKYENLKLKTNRIEALSDGVFAIAMTILIFSFEILWQMPQNLNEAVLMKTLARLWPDLLFYVESFLILGVFWVGHHRQFHFIKYVDFKFLFLNILWLMFIALIPLSTVVMGDCEDMRTAAFLFEGNLFIAGILLYVHWHYATANRQLVDEDLSPEVINLYKKRSLIVPFASLIAICLSAFHPKFGTLFYFAVPFVLLLRRMNTLRA